MIIDCHVHLCATQPGRGSMSQRLLNSVPFRYLQWKFNLNGADPETDDRLRRILLDLIDSAAPELDAAVLLAFDAVHDRSGRRDEPNTHLYVANDYVAGLAHANPRVLFGASVHPYRNDAIAELERCVRQGAALLKWLPITQGIDPSDPKCIPFYEALAHYRLPLLCHTGGEKTLPNLNRLRSPAILTEALRRGVTVIAAHCGTRSTPWEEDAVPVFQKMCREYEHFYGDTSALNWAFRSYAYEALLKDEVAMSRLIHGSDWPILPLPPLSQLDLSQAWAALRERNWLKRDVLIKRQLGFDDAYFHRAATVLRR